LGQEYEDFNSLFEPSGKIQKVFIASAYADPKTIRSLFNHFASCECDKRGCQFSVFIDRAASQALEGQKLRSKYKRLNTNIKKSIFGPDSGIRLVGGKLFHSKLIYIKTTVEEFIVVGSMNMTQKGTIKDENEEIIVLSQKPSKKFCKDIVSYFGYLSLPETSSWIDDCESAPKQVTFRDFFMNGSLYVRFAPTNLFSFTLNLPEAMRGATARLHPFLDAEAKNSISMLRFCYENGQNPFQAMCQEQIAGKAEHWTAFCFETLHGYWAPNVLCYLIDDILFEKKDDKLNEITNAFRLLSTPDVERRVYTFFDQLENSIFQQDGAWSASDAKKRWNQWRDRLLKRVFKDGLDSEIDEAFALRLSLGVQKSSFFDIFNDSDHAEEFIETVMDFIRFNLDRKGVKNKIIKILKSFPIAPETSEDFLKIIQSQGNQSFLKQLETLTE
jgi:hypothetical protein